MRAALAALRSNPGLGEPLEPELGGMHRLRVGQHRIVYRRTAGLIEVGAIGPRRTIHTDLERQARLRGDETGR